MNKIIMLFVITLIFTSVFTGYGMWFQNLKTNIYVKTGDIDWKISSHLVFVLHECECHCHCGCGHFHEIDHSEVSISNDNHTITISINFTNCHHHRGSAIVWAGMIIENTGEIPIRISGIDISIYGDYHSVIKDYYMYGPYTSEDLNNVCNWSNIDPDDLPFPNSTDELVLDPGMKGIIWLYILIIGGEEHLLISVEPATSSWNT